MNAYRKNCLVVFEVLTCVFSKDNGGVIALLHADHAACEARLGLNALCRVRSNFRNKSLNKERREGKHPHAGVGLFGVVLTRMPFFQQ